MFAVAAKRFGASYKRALDFALSASAVLVLAGWLIIAIIHLDDRYQVLHGQGAWMALARHANVNGLYPSLFDGTSYGGTRHMPATILLHAAMGRLTGEYLVSGKIVGLLTTLALTGAVFGVLRAARCPPAWSLGLAASVIGGYAGLRAGTTIGGEPLPVLFGVAALAVVLHRRSGVALIVAAVLSALGVCAKLSALWAPAGIFAWLLLVEPRRAAAFAASVVVATAAALGAFNLISEGRLFENLVVTSGAGSQGVVGLIKAPARLLGYLVEGEPAVWAFIPVLACVAGTRRWGAAFSLFPLAWLAAVALLVVIYGDIGTGPNQLLDLATLTVVCVGVFVGAADVRERTDQLIVLMLAAILLWSNVTAFVVRVRPPLQEAVGAVVSGRDPYPRHAILSQLAAEHSILSEDPGVVVELGRSPIVLDAFMLRRIAQQWPGIVGSLVERIERREFGVIVLVVALDDPNDVWWRDYEFGTDVINAVNQNYLFEKKMGPHYLYRARP